MSDHRRRTRGIERMMPLIIERKVPKCSTKDIMAKSDEWAAAKVDSIIPTKETQLSTTERTSATAAIKSGTISEGVNTL